MFEEIKKILSIYNKAQKNKIIVLVIMGLIGAVAESLSLGIVIPYMSVIMNPEYIKNIVPLNAYITNWSNTEIIIASSAVLLFAFIIKNIYLLFMAYVQANFVFNQQLKFSVSLLKNYLMKPYAYFFSHNVAEAQRNLNSNIQQVMQIVMFNLITLFCEAIVAVLILSFLLYNDPLSTLCIAILLGGASLLVYKKQRVAIARHGKNQQDANYEMVKWINQSISGIKELKVRENYDFYLDNVIKAGEKNASAGVFISVLGSIPRLLIETLTILALGLIVVINIIGGKNLSDTIPTLVLFAAGAYRLMPSFNRGLVYINSIKFYMPAFRNIYEDLIEIEREERSQQNDFSTSKQKLNRGDWSVLEVSDLSFRYSKEQDYVLKDVTLRLNKGEKIGIVGKSGQGKTTMLDIILGLLVPTSGRILLNEKDIYDDMSGWHKMIGYIPQNSVLIDDTIANNIALGINNTGINWEIMNDLIDKLMLKDMVDSLPQGLNTIVGENGICLSGGQKQRIVIARALYFEPEILVMDEVTSALDNDTESNVSEIIGKLCTEKTMIIVSHRDGILQYCDKIYKIENQKLLLDSLQQER